MVCLVLGQCPCPRMHASFGRRFRHCLSWVTAGLAASASPACPPSVCSRAGIARPCSHRRGCPPGGLIHSCCAAARQHAIMAPGLKTCTGRGRGQASQQAPSASPNTPPYYSTRPYGAKPCIHCHKQNRPKRHPCKLLKLALYRDSVAPSEVCNKRATSAHQE